MTNILDELDVIKNIEGMYESNSAFEVLKDFERVIDELDLYVYKNWEDGELAAGPYVDRHWITVKLFWSRDKMPDPMGAKRLIDYDCKVYYEKSYVVKPRKIVDPNDIRPGTKKGKLERHPIWIVKIVMPKKLLVDMFSANFEDLEIEDNSQDNLPQEPSPESQDQVAPSQSPEQGGAI